MKNATVKYQIVGLMGVNKNVALTKNFIVPEARDGHFETDRETGAMLEEALNISGQPAVLLKEGDPDYIAPTFTIVAKGETVEELKHTLAMANAKIVTLKEDIVDLQKELDKVKADLSLATTKGISLKDSGKDLDQQKLDEKKLDEKKLDEKKLDEKKLDEKKPESLNPKDGKK